jgi:transposase-like protein
MAYSQEDKIALAEHIASLIIEKSVAEACKEVGLAESTFFRWLASDKDVWEHYARAREILALKGETELEQVNRDLRNTLLEPQQARVIADNIKWLMGRRHPKVYGDRQFVEAKNEHSGPNGGPIQHDVSGLTDEQLAAIAAIAKGK